MERLENILIALACVLIAAMLILMNAEVFMRYVFSTSLKISEEYAGYLFAAATMFGFYPALMRGRFLRISALVSRLPLRPRAFWETIVGAVSAAFCLVVAAQTWTLFITSQEFGSVSEQYSATPLMYPQVILPAAWLLLAMGMLYRAFTVAKSLWVGDATLVREEEHVME
jgi:TRAP-type C4-dicarboxylate transport system permease small subunit